jgi:hypothetical protein
LVPYRAARSRKDRDVSWVLTAGASMGGMSGRLGGFYSASFIQPSGIKQLASSADRAPGH